MDYNTEKSKNRIQPAMNFKANIASQRDKLPLLENKRRVVDEELAKGGIKESGVTVVQVQKAQDTLFVDKTTGDKKLFDDDTAQQRAERRKKIKKNVRNIAFEGGGVKAFAYTGFYYFMEEYALMSEVKEVIGASAGGLMAALVALKIPAYDAFREMLLLDFEKFADDSFGIFRDANRFYKKSGIYKGEVLLQTVGEILERHAGSLNVTFQDIFDKTGIKLILTGTCINSMKTIYFHKDNKDYPDMQVRHALRITMSLPYAYQYYTYLGKDFIDGAMLNNLPISYWDKLLPDGKGLDKNPETLGVMISKPDEYMDNINYRYDNVIQFTNSFINALIDKASSAEFVGERFGEGKWLRTVEINTGDIGVLKFKLENKDFETMFESGYKATADFFQVDDSIDLVFKKLDDLKSINYSKVKKEKDLKRKTQMAKEGRKSCSCALI